MRRTRKAQVSTNNMVILAVAAVVIIAGVWWWTSNNSGSPEPSPSPNPSDPPEYILVTYTGFGFSFEHPEGLIFADRKLMGGVDHARPRQGAIQSLDSEDIPLVMGVIWAQVESAPDLEDALDTAFGVAQESGLELEERGPTYTGTKDGGEMVYQTFEASSDGNSLLGAVSTWFDDDAGRVYHPYVVSDPEIYDVEAIISLLLETVDSFEHLGIEGATELEAYWPTDGWRVATPEAAGIDPAKLDQMIEAVDSRGIGADSLMVIRHGYIVSDAYFEPYNPWENHIIYSCTKSVVSTLIGIAIDEGYIDADLDQRVMDIFSGRTPRNPSDWKSDMTLRDLLMMSAGFDARDSYLYNWEGLDGLHGARDAIRYMLDLEMAFEPGSRFEYTNGVSHLLSCIITEATGMSALEFAEEQLFEPMGITGAEWSTDSQGNNWGYSNLRITPHDMAKFGYLFLHGGEWDGEQVVPRIWVEEATSEQIDAGTLLDGYGYQWWASDDGYFSAIGYMGQFIHVVPELDLIMVTTGRDPNDFNRIQNLLEEFVIPSVID
jgi:CubicO group peptidase (beta-lactamase class C family)